MNMEEVETKDVKCELDCTEDTNKSRCDELEERSKKAEARVIELEQEIKKRKREYEELEAKFRELEAQNKSLGAELYIFRTGDNEITRHGNSVEDKNTVNLTEKGDRETVIDQLMTQNRVLECEKREAESEVVVWKDKFKELELRVSKMDVGRTERGGKPVLNDIVEGENKSDVKYNTVGATGCVPRIDIENLRASGKRYKDIACSHTPLAREEGVCSSFKGKYHREVTRYLSFDIGKNIYPSTPGASKPADVNVINVFDSDGESDIHVSTEHVFAETSDGKEDEICLQDYEEDVNECTDKVPSVLTSKRKRVAKMVTSDTESDEEDDNVPIAKLKKFRNPEKISRVENSDVNGCLASPSSCMNGKARFAASRSRRHLVTLRQSEEKVMKQEQARPTSDDVDNEPEEVGSESEGESLDGFIVNISDSSGAHDDPSHSGHESDGGSSAHDVSNHSENESDGSSSVHNVLSHSENESEGLDEILCKLERSKDGKKCKWEFEGDMLSAFGKDLELCMRAVCALYRQQTSDEQLISKSMHENSRGFSKIDALRGSKLAEFLINGDPEGDLKKSKQQLEEFGSSAVDLCRTLATHYSKQLFEIYKNKEDPLFLPF